MRTTTKNIIALLILVVVLSIVMLPWFSTLHSQNQIELESLPIDTSKLIGLQYIVFNDSQILYSKAVGLSNIKHQIKMKDTTRMMAYSMSKTYTAILVLRLAQEKLIDLNAPVKSYLPLIPYPDELKVGHLVSQTSGIPNPIPLNWVHLAEQEFDSTHMLYKLLSENETLEFEPGIKYAYSNLSYWLLEEIIQTVTGKNFEDVIFEKLFSKAGLNRDEISFDYKGNDVATGYLSNNFFVKLFAPLLIDKRFFGNEENGWLSIRPHILYSGGMGGIIASGESLARVMIEALRTDSKILNSDSKKLLFKIQRSSSGNYIPMTYGFHIDFDRNNSVNYYYKEGGGASFHTEIRYYPEKKIGTLVMANSNSFDVKDFLSIVDPYFTAGHSYEVKE